MARWLIVGDSHTEVLGPLLAEQLGGDYVYQRGQGVGSYLRAGWLREAAREVRPNRVLILLGGNDGRWSTEQGAAEYRGQVAQLIGEARQAGAEPLWVGPFYSTEPSVLDRHAKAGWEIARVCGALGVPFLDGMDLSVDLPRTPDGVHYPRASYQRMAPTIASWAKRQKGASGWVYAAVGAGVAAAALAAWALFAD